MSLTHEEFVENLKTVNPDVVVMGKFTGLRNKIKLFHIPTQREWETRAERVYYKSVIRPKWYKESTDEYKEKLKNIRDDIEIIGNYINAKTPVLCYCKIHNIEFEAKPINISRNHSVCPICKHEKLVKTQLFSHEEFVNMVQEINPYIEIISNYRGCREYVFCRCLICKHEWKVTGTGLLHSKSSCPHCSSSKGEKRICLFLNEHNINYKSQYRFDDCRDKYPLPFDFAIFDKNNELIFLCEYQGHQHYYPVDFGNKGQEWALNVFQQGQFRDKLKKDYCKNNNIDLLVFNMNEMSNIKRAVLGEKIGTVVSKEAK